MSKCISSNGEYSEHTLSPDGDCDFCGVSLVGEKMDAIYAQNEEILSILRPLAGFVANDLPRLAEEAGPIINGLKNSPVLKMMGVSL